MLGGVRLTERDWASIAWATAGLTDVVGSLAVVVDDLTAAAGTTARVVDVGAGVEVVVLAATFLTVAGGNSGGGGGIPSA